MKCFTILFILFISCSKVESLPFYTQSDLTPKWIDPDSELYDNIHKIPPFSFINQYGDTVTEKTFENKIYIANFMFTSCPGICPKMSKNISNLQTKLKEDTQILFLSHSVTPEKDSVSVLHSYAQKHHAIKGKWHLITGKRKEIYDIARNSYFADEDLGYSVNENEILHTENFVLIDKKRRIRGVYNGTLPADCNRLIDDLKQLQSSVH